MRERLDMDKKTQERFWSKIRKSPGCWLWQGGQNHYGYGAFKWRGRSWNANRIALELSIGKLRNTERARHKCDVRACCRPSHLEPGTQLDNVRDMESRGRAVHVSGDQHPSRLYPGMRKGEKNGRAKLTYRQVVAIRRQYKRGGATMAEIAERYGVSAFSVCSIINRKTWCAPKSALIK